ncbi:hypothetical protein AB6809_30995 [Paraburkholderia sp. RCC_158]|uniref:hypothetical protein n=1 Tax=Paraburkholderia sp. RCC_158 TaxID=3239220 RepID=UPI0035253AD3
MDEVKKLYGEAVREFESGIRRDEIWGSAFVNAGGNPQQASAIYVDLLAEHLSHAGAEIGPRNRRRTKWTWTALEIFLWLVTSFSCAGACTAITRIFLEGSGISAQMVAALSLGVFWVSFAVCAVFTWRRTNAKR